jgi:hypothetical protein
MVTLHLRKDEVARSQRDKILRLDKIKFEVELEAILE